jgi:hypothetical protein
MKRTALVASLLSLAAGCGDGDAFTELEGMYELASWTHNQDGCGEEGPASAEQSLHTHFFVRHDTYLGEEILDAVMCDDLDACRTMAADQDTVVDSDFLFASGNDNDGWTGASSRLSTGEASCAGSVFDLRLTGDRGASVRIDEESRSVSDVPLDDTGECQVGAEFEQASGLPCEQLTVVVGTYVEPI